MNDHRKLSQRSSTDCCEHNYLGIFLLGRKTDVASIAGRMVSRAEIVHLQLALVQQYATTAHFRMGIGYVLLRKDFVRRSIR